MELAMWLIFVAIASIFSYMLGTHKAKRAIERELLRVLHEHQAKVIDELNRCE